MKQAGLKNDGAWYRMNKFMKRYRAEHPTSAIANMKNKIASTDGIAEYVAALNDIVDKTGVSTTVMTVDVMAQTWAQSGFPRQVWMGVLTFDTYDSSTGAYKAAHWREAMVFGYNIRANMTAFRRGFAQIADVQNSISAKQGNPGGIADADIDT